MNENAVKRKEPAENISNEIRRSRSQGEKENKNSDYLTRMIIIQFVMCLAFVGILFALNKWGGNYFAELKKEYMILIKKNLIVKQNFISEFLFKNIKYLWSKSSHIHRGRFITC